LVYIDSNVYGLTWLDRSIVPEQSMGGGRRQVFGRVPSIADGRPARPRVRPTIVEKLNGNFHPLMWQPSVFMTTMRFCFRFGDIHPFWWHWAVELVTMGVSGPSIAAYPLVLMVIINWFYTKKSLRF
jgi:hypothetical protein